MQLSRLLGSYNVIPKLRILSFEMNIYLVEVELADFCGLVRDAKDNPMRFSSVTEVKNAFAECRVSEAELVHESPYDEMIGNPPRAKNQMVLPIIMSISEA